MIATMYPDQSWYWRALQLFAAASIALSLAVILGLQNPFWAAMPVWVVAQANRQDMMLRAVLRVVGTAVGGVLGWLTLVYLPSPVGHMALLTLTLGCGAALAYWIGTAYNYGVILAAITIAVVIVPAMDHPVDAAAFARDRVLCTLIGVVTVTAITFLFTPNRTAPLPARTVPPMVAVLRHGVIAAIAACVAAMMVHFIGGAAGVGGALALCIFGTFIAANRDPKPMLDHMPPGATIGVLAALVYRALDIALPDQTIYALLLAFPFIAVGSLFRSNPRSAPIGLDANTCFLLTAQAGTAGLGFAPHAIGGAALIVCLFGYVAFFRWAEGMSPRA